MLRENKSRTFTNGKVYSLLTEDGYPVEVTDTFLPFYTKDELVPSKTFSMTTTSLIGLKDG